MTPPPAPVLERPPAYIGVLAMKVFDGKKLKAARERRELTQVDLADVIDIPLSTIRNWEQGRSTPSVQRLARTAIALGVRTDDLLTETEV